MPRVAVNKKKYMITDLSRWIVGKMHEKDLNQEDIGRILGINQQSVSRRLLNSKKGSDVFSQGELILLFKELEATDAEILRLIKM